MVLVHSARLIPLLLAAVPPLVRAGVDILWHRHCALHAGALP
jgi:hypothetical protein